MTPLLKLRKQRHYSQIKMQALTGIDQSDYSKIETGKRNMTFEQWEKATTPKTLRSKTVGRVELRAKM